MSDTKKWIKVTRTAKGDVSVRVTLQRDMAVANWAVKAFSTPDAMKTGVLDATKGAEAALAVIEEVLADETTPAS